jgi:thiamine-monophosphate kinase
MAERALPGEFELIARHFAPLAAGVPGALGLADDAGLIAPSPGCELVVTTDTLIAGVHFLAADAPDLVARKALRVNLSDLAGMGARPLVYLLNLSVAPGTTEPWVAGFAAGLRADQDGFGVGLLGGDTTSTPGPLTITVTAIGEVPVGAALRRSGARQGDAVFVSGTIGDAALGLDVIQGRLAGLAPDLAQQLRRRYLVPEPRVALGVALRGIAHAAMDVSDGLVADLGHICAASGVAAVIEAARVPLSAAASAAVADDPRRLETAALTGGDDYELLFTVARTAATAVVAAAAGAGVAVTQIGRIEAGSGVTAVGADGRPLRLGRVGYRHF